MLDFHKTIGDQVVARAAEYAAADAPDSAEKSIHSVRRAIDIMGQLQRVLVSGMTGVASGAEEADRKATLLLADSLLLDVYIAALHLVSHTPKLHVYVAAIHDDLLGLIRLCWEQDKPQALYYRALTFSVLADDGAYIPNAAAGLDDVIRSAWRARAAERLMWAERVIAVTPQHPLNARVKDINAQLHDLLGQALMKRVRLPLQAPSTVPSKKGVTPPPPPTPQNNSDGCFFKAVMFKLGRVVKNWKERVFCVRNTGVQYFRVNSSGQLTSSGGKKDEKSPLASSGDGSPSTKSDNGSQVRVGKTKGTIEYDTIEDISEIQASLPERSGWCGFCTPFPDLQNRPT